MIPLTEQLYAFLLTTLAGICLGIIYDFLRLIRHYLKNKIWFTQMGDTIYWILVTPFVFFVLLQGTWGEVRLWVFLSLALGASMYIYFLSEPILRGMILITNWIGRVILTLFNILVWPIKALLQLIAIPFGIVAKVITLLKNFLRRWWNRLVREPITKAFRKTKHRGSRAVNKFRRKASLWISPKKTKRK